MKLQLVRAETTEQIEHVAALAKMIWREYFPPIIGAPQVEYMLEKFQSFDAIQSQCTGSYTYYLAKQEDTFAGYIALVPNEHQLIISKLYIARLFRGKGVGKRMLDFAEKTSAGRTMLLTVNKYNTPSISWYKKQGFTITDSVKNDIGEGFFMDDYIMEKPNQNT